MDIHIRSRIQKSPILNHPSLSCCKPIAVVLFPDLLKNLQRRGKAILSKCGDNSSRKPSADAITQLRFRGCRYDFNYFKVRNFCERNVEVQLSIFIQAKDLNHRFAKVYSLKKTHFSFLEN